MYYDYPEEEFYPESEYQEQIDALKEAIKSSVKSEILEEMNRLRAENEKLQGVKEHFEEVKKDYEKKKDECDRIIRNAEYNAKKMRLSELMKDHKVVKWKVDRELVYGPKCCKCNSNRSGWFYERYPDNATGAVPLTAHDIENSEMEVIGNISDE